MSRSSKSTGKPVTSERYLLDASIASLSDTNATVPLPTFNSPVHHKTAPKSPAPKFVGPASRSFLATPMEAQQTGKPSGGSERQISRLESSEAEMKQTL